MERRITFWNAWCLPNLVLYASAYFLSKFSLYVVFFSLFEWLDTFMALSDQEKANISTMNDVGAIIGVFLAGYISDLTYGKRSPVTLVACMLAALIFIMFTVNYGEISYTKLMFSFFFFGMFSNGSSATIVGTASADIGKSAGEKGVSTVTGIIDGTGSFGSSVGQFTVGATETAYGWRKGYCLLISIV